MKQHDGEMAELLVGIAVLVGFEVTVKPLSSPVRSRMLPLLGSEENDALRPLCRAKCGTWRAGEE